ncbi:TRAP transporter substrate-binding protein [Desulfotalea psychrophila]|uniref:Probable DctP (Periplasmic C4-dicarboxylate binding protein) n=1 Tax=Desulfotalea psychrophila (strain LSv54 / DSM 12343) TaxID=177439 RepID=Q6AR51_DESPS|nr:TRAP transporter substrate-binding protein DctP [Desulfotalea psychrophila]CAG35173.1 probable DctP (periplasmic C4-dicarboxylate binding protein) [Desulfotalea psychrophila LSv54]
MHPKIHSHLYTALFIFALILSTTLGVSEGQARAKYSFKIGSLAPEGSIWITQFRAFAKEVTEKTDGEVGFRIYPGGIMGDDQAMYRKIRVGQLHGGGFTMSGIADIVPDFRIMAIPFLFNSYAEIDHVRKGLRPMFEERFANKGLRFLAFTEVGFVYAMSKARISTFAELKATKNWTPSGDRLSTGFLKTAGITPIQLSLPDVLSSLQTGMIDTVYNSLYGSIVLQWFTSIKYINTVPSGYAYGTILLDDKFFNKLPKNYQEIVNQTARKYFPPLIAKTRTTNAESKTVLEEKGISFLEPEAAMTEKLSSYQQEVINNSIGKLFSVEAYDKMAQLLKEHRSGAAE